MYGVHLQSTRGGAAYSERQTAGGIVGYAMVAVAVMAFFAAPAAVVGVVAGLVAVRYGGPLIRAVRRWRGGPPSPGSRSHAR